MLRVRKSVNSLTAAEKANLVAAIKALKANGRYDQYVNEHNAAMNQATVLPGEPNSPSYRNVAHRGPAFLPWHREFLRRFELDLQTEVPGVTLPYWDWAADSVLANPENAPIWQPDLMGGDGDPSNGGQVSTGPFRYDPDDPDTWGIVTNPGDPGPGLSRALGQGGHLPTQSEIDTVAMITTYDSPQWNTASDPSFRNELEGWSGPNLHNAVHVWVGGSMLVGTSPNDPAFFLHHCNVDRLWWQWQQKYPDAGYVPTIGGPPGHNLNDQMSPWDAATTPASVLDIHKLGYAYARPGEPHCHPAGKVCGIVYDRYGDFDGFLLDTPHGERRYVSREKGLAQLIERAWSRRLRITVITDIGEPACPQEIILCQPPTRCTPDPCCGSAAYPDPATVTSADRH